MHPGTGNHLVCYGSVAQQVNVFLARPLNQYSATRNRIDIVHPGMAPRWQSRSGQHPAICAEFIPLPVVVFVKQPFGVRETARLR